MALKLPVRRPRASENGGDGGQKPGCPPREPPPDPPTSDTGTSDVGIRFSNFGFSLGDDTIAAPPKERDCDAESLFIRDFFKHREFSTKLLPPFENGNPCTASYTPKVCPKRRPRRGERPPRRLRSKCRQFGFPDVTPDSDYSDSSDSSEDSKGGLYRGGPRNPTAYVNDADFGDDFSGDDSDDDSDDFSYDGSADFSQDDSADFSDSDFDDFDEAASDSDMASDYSDFSAVSDDSFESDGSY